MARAFLKNIPNPEINIIGNVARVIFGIHLLVVLEIKISKCSTGLELDIYCPEYGFAIEVQGEQHENILNSSIEEICPTAKAGSTQKRIMQRKLDRFKICLVL